MPKVFPVVHVNTRPQAVEQAGIAFEAGADGVYLIDHYGRRGPEYLSDTFEDVQKANPGRFVGVNFLGLAGPDYTLDFLKGEREKGYISRYPDAIWFDNSFVGVGKGMLVALEATKQMRQEDRDLRRIQLLGGVSFKYTQTYTEDPTIARMVTRVAAPYLDVVTTSGPGTGMAPTPGKIHAMKAAANEAGKQLAVASGVDAANLASYGGSIDQVLVASSVETKPYSGIFDQSKLEELIQVAHGLDV